MKKKLAILCLLLAPVIINQSVSVRQFRQMRNWMTGREASEILVGVAWPFAANEDGFKEGLLLAQEAINARGVRGKRIQLQMRDDRLDREESRRIAIDFASNPGMVAVLGYYDDKLAVRASAIFEEAGLLHIVAGANNTYMTTHGFRYLVRSVLASDRIGQCLGRLCMDRGYRNFAIVYEDGAFGEDLAYQTAIELDARDARVVYQASYVAGKVEFRETIDELKQAGADVVLLLGLERESAQFIKLASDLGLKTPIVGSFSDTPLMRAIAGKALEGAMFYELYDVNSPSPQNRAFVARYRQRFGKDPDTYGAQGYDALWLLAKAIETTGSSNALDLAYAIRSMDGWEGANGSYKFDSDGELHAKDVYLKAYRAGKPVVIATSHPDAQAPSPAR